MWKYKDGVRCSSTSKGDTWWRRHSKIIGKRKTIDKRVLGLINNLFMFCREMYIEIIRSILVFYIMDILIFFKASLLNNQHENSDVHHI
jgi:hypothetical protein